VEIPGLKLARCAFHACGNLHLPKPKQGAPELGSARDEGEFSAVFEAEAGSKVSWYRCSQPAAIVYQNAMHWSVSSTVLSSQQQASCDRTCLKVHTVTMHSRHSPKLVNTCQCSLHNCTIGLALLGTHRRAVHGQGARECRAAHDATQFVGLATASNLVAEVQRQQWQVQTNESEEAHRSQAIL
jgi:hypothetical protein